MRHFGHFIALAALAAGSPVMAQRSTSAVVGDVESPVLLFSVRGKASAKPDVGTISGGVQSTSNNASEAMRMNNRKMASVIDTIRSAGVKSKDIQTSGISLRKHYEWENDKRVEKGFRASNSINVHIRNTEDLGKILQAIVDSGATNINGPNFSLEDDSKLVEEARAKAIKKAAALAQSYAKQTGFREAKLVSITEGYGSEAELLYNLAPAEAAADAAAGTVPVEVGEVAREVSITARYRLVK